MSSAVAQGGSAYLATSASAGATLANPANGFTGEVRSGTLQVSAGSDTWDMSLVGLGYGGRCSRWEPLRPRPVATGSIPNYAAVDEWYVNGPSGLEQGFTVPPLSQSEAGGSLTVELALGGDLTATLNRTGTGLTLTRPDGSAALGYTGLTAYDATGKALPASLQVQTDGGRQELLIHVNDAGAKGQITIDPVVTVSTFVSNGLDEPVALAFDSAGNLYVANAGNNTISKVTPAGVVSTFVSSGLDVPAGLAFDSAGNLYVANEGNSTISKVTPAGVVSTFVSSG